MKRDSEKRVKSPYRCEEHRLDLICPGCVNAWISRHDKMLEFVKKIAYQRTEHEEMAQISWDAQDLLKEIGKL